jgi:hypothetical protein
MPAHDFFLFPFDAGRWWHYRIGKNRSRLVRIQPHTDYDDQVQYRLEELAPLAAVNRGSLVLMDVVRVGFAEILQPQPLLVLPSDLQVGLRWNVLRFDGQSGQTLEHHVSSLCRIRTPGGRFDCYQIRVEEGGRSRLTCWVAPGVGIVSWRSTEQDGDFIDFGARSTS